MAGFDALIRFNKLPNVLDILGLLESRTGFKYQFTLTNTPYRGDDSLHCLKIDNITTVLLEINNYYKRKDIPLHSFEIDLSLNTNSIAVFDGMFYELQVLRQILSDLGTISEDGHIYVPVDDDFVQVKGDLRHLDPIPHYAILPWYHPEIPIKYLENLREQIGWNPKNRPPFVSKEFIEQIERGMPISKPRRKK